MLPCAHADAAIVGLSLGVTIRDFAMFSGRGGASCPWRFGFDDQIVRLKLAGDIARITSSQNAAVERHAKLSGKAAPSRRDLQV